MDIKKTKFLLILFLILFSFTSIIYAKEDTPSVYYATHLENLGWLEEVANGKTSGAVDKGLQIEAVKIRASLSEGSSIEYQSHISDIGWEENWKKDDEVTGTTGESKRLEAIRIRLNGEDAENYDVYYRTYLPGFGWLGWAKNGEDSGSLGLAKPLEALEVTLVKKNAKAPGTTDYTSLDKASVPITTAESHVENVGWTEPQSFETTIGTTGLSQRLEAIRLSLNNLDNESGIEYQSHVQDYGWEEDWKSNGETSGTEGKALRIEAIKIQLTGPASENYDIYYQAHVANMGWLDWAKNGEPAGTSRASLKMEALNIKIVPKGSEAPGSTYSAYVIPISTEDFLGRIYGCWIDAERAEDPTKSYIVGLSNTYMMAGYNLSFEGFEGKYNVVTASATGGKIEVNDKYNNQKREAYISFEDLPVDRIRFTSDDGVTKELIKGVTTDNIHYTFPGLIQYGQSLVVELKN